MIRRTKPNEIDSRQLPFRVFLCSLVILAIAQTVVFVNKSIADYMEVSRFWPDKFNEVHWAYHLDLIELSWLLLVPLIALVASDLKSSFRKSVVIFVGLFASFLFMFSFLVHELVHFQVQVTAPDLERMEVVDSCYSSFGFWISTAVSTLTHMLYLFGTAYAIRYWLLSNDSLRRAEKSRLKTEQLNQTLIQLKHESLCRRLQPHFLFNALNTIGALTVSRPDEAREVVGRLGTLLRVSLDTLDDGEIDLAREFELIGDYLRIQQLRFGERLTFFLEMEPGLETTKIPAFILQPLVENSVKHGFESENGSEATCVSIRVSARRANNEYVISVVDDNSPGLPATQIVEHLGLRLTRDRLRLQYAETASVQVESSAGNGFSVTLRIPATEYQPPK